MSDIEPGQMLLDINGRLAGVVTWVTDDTLIVRRRGFVVLPADDPPEGRLIKARGDGNGNGRGHDR